MRRYLLAGLRIAVVLRGLAAVGELRPGHAGANPKLYHRARLNRSSWVSEAVRSIQVLHARSPWLSRAGVSCEPKAIQSGEVGNDRSVQTCPDSKTGVLHGAHYRFGIDPITIQGAFEE
jgi:hypothetical protein